MKITFCFMIYRHILVIHSAFTGGLKVISDFIKSKGKNLQHLYIKTQQER